MLDTEGYEVVYSTESMGSNGAVGVKVLVYQPGALTRYLAALHGLESGSR